MDARSSSRHAAPIRLFTRTLGASERRGAVATVRLEIASYADGAIYLFEFDGEGGERAATPHANVDDAFAAAAAGYGVSRGSWTPLHAPPR